jgi:hypothetical protein
MTALAYDMLADLCDRRIGMRDVACPLCGSSRRSPANRTRRVFRIWHRERGFISYHCARCGEGGWVREDGAGDNHLNERVVNDGDEDHAARQLQKVAWLWHRRRPVEGAPAEHYLRKVRGYAGTLPPTLGFLPPSRPEHHPALIAAFGIPDEIEPGILDIEEVLHGVHLTLLRPNGSGKTNTGRDKIMVGPSKGWPIVLAAPNDLLAIAVTEGIEDGLSVHQATGLGVWAAGSAGRMPALAEKVPPFIEAVTIYAHADEAGQRGMHGLADALVSRGIDVFIEGLAL